MRCPHCGKGDEHYDMVITEHLPDGSYKEWKIDLVWVSFPSGATGYRLEYWGEDAPFSDDMGTLTIIDGKAIIVQW